MPQDVADSPLSDQCDAAVFRGCRDDHKESRRMPLTTPEQVNKPAAKMPRRIRPDLPIFTVRLLAIFAAPKVMSLAL